MCKKIIAKVMKKVLNLVHFKLPETQSKVICNSKIDLRFSKIIFQSLLNQEGNIWFFKINKIIIGLFLGSADPWDGLN